MYVCHIKSISYFTFYIFSPMIIARMTMREFQREILGWHEKHGRHTLPWRKTHNPYKIFVSEVMLQQTQVDRVIPKYQNFLKQFPTVSDLAHASQKNVLFAWKGLGYNRRALNMQKAAQEIVKTYHGKFPKDPEQLDALPGIGHYTARAICVFAWNEPQVFIETNIRRVFLHYFFQDADMVRDSQIMPIIKQALYLDDPRKWYFALMDFGAGPLKKVLNPNRKSTGYVKQSKFEGSRRYVRAKILDICMRADRALSLSEIQRSAKKDVLFIKRTSEFPDILKELTKEGFLAQEGNKWRVRE